MSTSPQTTQPDVTPRRILATLQAYRDAAALNTAIELELFTRIAQGVDTPGRIAAELGIPVRGVRLLCEYLVGTGLLEKEDEQLRLAADAALYLNQKSPGYLGNLAPVLNSPQLLRGYQGLTEAVRTGHASKLELGDTKDRPEWFDAARGLTDEAVATGAFAETVKLPTGEPLKILDLGSHTAAFGIALAMLYPESVIVALNCPKALSAAQERADAAKLGTRYQNIPGEPLVAPFGREYDAALVAGNLNQFDPGQIAPLMTRVHHALKKTGQLLILEFLSDDNPEFMRGFAGFRLNMLAATSKGDSYSFTEVKGMLESSGFRSIDTQPLPAACAMLVTARP